MYKVPSPPPIEFAYNKLVTWNVVLPPAGNTLNGAVKAVVVSGANICSVYEDIAPPIKFSPAAY